MDAKIFAAHVRGLSPRRIGERLQLPTEYVERRLPHLSETHSHAGMTPDRQTMADRTLALLREADGYSATIEELMAIHRPRRVPGPQSALVAVRVAITTLRDDGHRIEFVHRYVADTLPRLESTSRVMRAMADLLASGPATPDALAQVGGVPTQQVKVYVHLMRQRGGSIRQIRTYVLTPEEVAS